MDWWAELISSSLIYSEEVDGFYLFFLNKRRGSVYPPLHLPVVPSLRRRDLCDSIAIWERRFQHRSALWRRTEASVRLRVRHGSAAVGHKGGWITEGRGRRGGGERFGLFLRSVAARTGAASQLPTENKHTFAQRSITGSDAVRQHDYMDRSL